MRTKKLLGKPTGKHNVSINWLHGLCAVGGQSMLNTLLAREVGLCEVDVFMAI